MAGLGKVTESANPWERGEFDNPSHFQLKTAFIDIRFLRQKKIVIFCVQKPFYYNLIWALFSATNIAVQALFAWKNVLTFFNSWKVISYFPTRSHIFPLVEKCSHIFPLFLTFFHSWKSCLTLLVTCRCRKSNEIIIVISRLCTLNVLAYSYFNEITLQWNMLTNQLCILCVC